MPPIAHWNLLPYDPLLTHSTSPLSKEHLTSIWDHTSIFSLSCSVLSLIKRANHTSNISSVLFTFPALWNSTGELFTHVLFLSQWDTDYPCMLVNSHEHRLSKLWNVNKHLAHQSPEHTLEVKSWGVSIGLSQLRKALGPNRFALLEHFSASLKKVSMCSLLWWHTGLSLWTSMLLGFTWCTISLSVQSILLLYGVRTPVFVFYTLSLSWLWSRGC